MEKIYDIRNLGCAHCGSKIEEAINKLEEKAEHMMDEADALSELNQKAEDVNVDALTAKYDSVNADVAVDDELAKLKAEMGLSEQ